MNIRKWNKLVQRKIYKNWNEIQGVLLRKYPDFVLSDRVNEVVDTPAFVFHKVTNESLEPILRFLADNQYATLTADEYYGRLSKREKGQEREVLLTFDDGDKSLYTVAYPALKRYGLNAVAYIVPGMIPKGSASVHVEERSLCDWQEVREMHESGTLDIQSHGMYHHSIPISDRVMDFVRPGLNLWFLDTYLVPLIQEDGQIRKSHELPFGTPIYDWGLRFAEAPAFRDSPSARQACVQHVERFGAADYFRTSDWRRRLRAVLVEARQQDPAPGFETEGEQRRAILEDFLNSKHEIERRLPEKTVRHFCYPWFHGSALAAALSAEAGYISNARGSLIPSFVDGIHTPIPIARLSPSYIWRLPGRGRKPIRKVLLDRLSEVYNSKRTFYG